MMQDPDFAAAHEQKMENIRQWLKNNKNESENGL